jgi:hypothetical protein
VLVDGRIRTDEAWGVAEGSSCFGVHGVMMRFGWYASLYRVLFVELAC